VNISGVDKGVGMMAVVQAKDRLRRGSMMQASGTEQRHSPHVEGKTATTVAADVKPVLDIGDIAEMFKCSREKIKRMARRGEIPAFKFGKHWYVRKTDLERFLASRVELTGHLCRIQEV